MLSVISMLSICLYGCGGGATTNEGPIPEGPDYSDSNLQYDFYGYSAYSDGTWKVKGIQYSAGEDFRTVEKVKEYKDAGMTIFFPQSLAAYYGEDWETSETKKAMDLALEAGMDKVIIHDTRIQDLSRVTGGLIGEGKQFATEADLDAVIESYMAPYIDHPAFYGVMLADEPFYPLVEAYGQMYRAIKRVHPEVFVHYNLLPITAGNEADKIDSRFPALEAGEGEGLSEFEVVALRYEKYLRAFIEATGADYVQYDQYPLQASAIDEYHIYCMQMVTELAKEYNLDFYFINQTYAQVGNKMTRELSQDDLYWINNMAVGFGAKTISYYTYWTKREHNNTPYADGVSFMTWRGEKTNTYHWMQQIMAEEQKLAPTILNFDYVTSKVYFKYPTVFVSEHASLTLETPDFTALKGFEINKEIALVTELYDENNNNYMYMVQNIIDPQYKGSKVYQTATLTFDSKYKYAVIFEMGERTLVRLDNGTLTLKHIPGEATFVIPY